VLSPFSTAQVSVLTHHNDNQRTGQNLSETHLTPAVVNSGRFGQLFTQHLDGRAVAEPLYVPNVQINGTSHNVVFVVTLHDGVYAFDADNNTGANASPLWYTSLINPPNVTTVPIADQGCVMHGFSEMGILGTPVIDPNAGVIYLVAKTLESGNYVFRLHALNIQTGQEALGGPTVIQASYQVNGKTVTFVPQHRMNRPALLLSNGVIYLEFGTMGCKGSPPSTGWMMAYNASTLQQMAVLNVGPTQSATPGLWMSGDGPSVDSNGNVYLATGEGQFDFNLGGLDYGDTLLKVNLQGGNLSVLDYFTPFNQADLNAEDLDLGSGGLVMLPPQPGPFPNLGVLAGKQGMIYLINQDSLGEYNPVADQVVQELPFNPNSETELDGGATYWNQSIYFGGATDDGTGIPIQKFSLRNGLIFTTPLATANPYEIFSLLSISANGKSNGILWGVAQAKTGATVVAFNAANLTPLVATPLTTPVLHFVTPMIANGKVYVTTSGSLAVLGLLEGVLVSGGNNQTAKAATKLPKPLIVRVLSQYTGAPVPGVTVNFNDGGSGGVISNPSMVTNSNGYAGTYYTLPATPGTYQVVASGTAMTTAHFTEKATAAAQVGP
jgi:hypothetical protein